MVFYGLGSYVALGVYTQQPNSMINSNYLIVFILCMLSKVDKLRIKSAFKGFLWGITRWNYIDRNRRFAVGNAIKWHN